MNWLQIRLLGPYFSSFSTNSYGYYSQMSQNLVSNTQVFASALIVRQAAREFKEICSLQQAGSAVMIRDHQFNLTGKVIGCREDSPVIDFNGQRGIWPMELFERDQQTYLLSGRN